MEQPLDSSGFEQRTATLLAAGQTRQALEVLAEGIALTPDNPELCNLAGICAATLGQNEQAAQLWERTIALTPHARAHFNLGLLHANNGRAQEAEQHYRQAIALEPGNTPAHYNLAILLATAARFDEAEAAYRNTIALDPSNAAALTNLGALLAEQGRMEEAEQCYLHSLAAAPDHVAAHINLGVLLARQHRIDEGELHYRQAIALAPQSAQAHTNLGLLLEQSQRISEAEQCQRTALALDPDHAEIHSNLANLLAAQQRVTKAEQHYRLAIALKPGDATICSNLGALLSTLKRNEESEQCFRQAIALKPEYALAHLNLGQLLLSQGRYREGWNHHEYRYHTGLPDQIPFPAELPCPQWHGEPLDGKSLLVWPEQGLGDEIQFCRYLPLLQQQGANITLVCKAPLKPLMETLAGVERVLTLEEADTAAGTYDYWTFPLSLPLYCDTTPENIPCEIPYLHALPERIAQWAARLPQEGLQIGLVWRGNPLHSNDSERSLPGLAVLSPLWTVPGIHFISLQKDTREDLCNIPACQPLLHFGDELADFADTAAIAAQLDLLICVDTSTAHLAGALGKPCWVMLSDHKTDWRWMTQRSDTPWYPGRMRLFRQRQCGDWASVVEEVRAALEQYQPED